MKIAYIEKRFRGESLRKITLAQAEQRSGLDKLAGHWPQVKRFLAKQ